MFKAAFKFFASHCNIVAVLYMSDHTINEVTNAAIVQWTG